MIRNSMLKSILNVSPEISNAIKSANPVVALESTIITHGLPFPDNYQLATKAEQLVREAGCVPATIAVIDGIAKIGLTKNEIKALARGKNNLKLSTNDLSVSIANAKTGSTTVAATLALADLVNISVFATGGIGGAHRGSEVTFDISADLKQLSISSVSLVCAGPKGILDVHKTIEILETLGTPVITYKSKNIPAFWSSDSGIKSPNVAKNLNQIALSHKTRALLGLKPGQLICNPIPKYAEISNKIIEPIIQQAITEASERKIEGKELTPFLLSKILTLTDGDSMAANKILFLNNVKLASKLAKKLSAS